MTTIRYAEEQINADEQRKAIIRNRVTRLANVFARTNSVLTGRKISVSVVDEPTQKSPAWSSTTQVWLNLAEVKDDLTARGLLSLQGLDFHELAHLRYTPRNGSDLVKYVKAEGLWEAFNCLEDSRIENLLIGYLPSISNWLTATIADYLLSNDEAIKTAFPLVTGRYYLPTELRQVASDNYKRPQDRAELEAIVDEYCTLIFEGANTDSERAKPLIKKFAELLNQLPPVNHGGTPSGTSSGGECDTTVVYRVLNPNGHNSRPTDGWESGSHRPQSKAQQDKDLEKSKTTHKPKPVIIDIVVDEQEEAEEPTPTPTTNNDSEDSSKEDSFDDVTDDDVDSDSDFDDDDVDSDSEGKTPTPNNPSSQYGDEEGTTGTNQAVKDVLDDVLSDVLDELSKEVNQIAKQLGMDLTLDGGNAETPNKAKYKERPVPAELVLIAKSFGKELERLKAKYDPYWETETNSGRLNVQRYLDGEDFDTVFDEWQEGKDDVTSIEAVILLDKSGSMDGDNANNAYQSMWAIKKALEAVQARTTVALFDSRTTLLYGADDKAGTVIRDSGADGGTNPEKGLLYAKRVLAETDKAIRIVFVITDGLWNTEEGEKAIKEMRSAGVLTCQALITGGEVSNNWLEQNRHSFELLTQIKTAKDILALGKDVVRLAIARNLVSH